MKKIKELENEIIKNKILYYKGEARISDEEYDELELQLKKLDPNNEILKLIGTPIVKNKIKHDQKMLSLEKTYILKDLETWIENQDVLITFKIDGSSCSLVYLENNLIIAKTRGDGEFGENITDKVFFIPEIIKKIELAGKIEIRGEIYCDEENFIKLCDEMVKRNLEKPNSQRNIVAGLLGRKDHKDLCKYLSFKAFEIISEENLKTEEDKLKLLRRNKFKIPEYEIANNIKQIEKFLENTKEFIENGDYLIDGAVFTFNSIEFQNSKGITSHHPRFKIAFKFQGESKEVVIKSITWQVSRNGVLTPVAEIEATELSGATISRVTLHNMGLVEEFKLKTGDKIEIVRSGEVIPKFLSLKKSSDEKFLLPKNCPCCNSELIKEDIRLICTNDNCEEKIIEEINYFLQQIGIEDLSRMRIKEMMSKKIVRRIEDIYILKYEQLLELEKVKEKLASKLIKNIENSKKIDLLTFLVALGLSGGAKAKCEKIIDNGFDTIEKILNLNIEDIVKIEGFAEKSAEDFLRSIVSKKKLIKKLIELGLNPENNRIKTSDKLKGLKFCITGALSRKREIIEEEIKSNGGSIVGSVSAKTNYLLTNEVDSTSSKYKKAKELNIKIINEKEFEKMII